MTRGEIARQFDSNLQNEQRGRGTQMITEITGFANYI